jgi:ribosomal protein S18 acetylase RimI-like enzyme
MRQIEEGDIAACYPVMRQLRPHLSDPEDFVNRWRRQTAGGYHLVAIQAGLRPTALAGYRFLENLVHGPFLYVDDLIVDENARNERQGARLIDWLKEEARTRGCRKLVLDTALGNALAQRFYFRNGLLSQGLHFSTLLD